MADSSFSNSSDPHCPVARYSKVIFPFIDEALKSSYYTEVAGFSKRPGETSIEGNPTIYNVHFAEDTPPDLELDKSPALFQAYLYRDSCELVSKLIWHEGFKVLPAFGWKVEMRRGRMKARTVFADPGAEDDETIELPNHAYVYASPFKSDDKSAKPKPMVLDGSLPQFGWPISDRLINNEEYKIKYKSDVDPITFWVQRPDLRFRPYWSKVLAIKDKVLKEFPWEKKWSVQVEAREQMLAKAIPMLQAAAEGSREAKCKEKYFF